MRETRLHTTTQATQHSLYFSDRAHDWPNAVWIKCYSRSTVSAITYSTINEEWNMKFKPPVVAIPCQCGHVHTTTDKSGGYSHNSLE